MGYLTDLTDDQTYRPPYKPKVLGRSAHQQHFALPLAPLSRGDGLLYIGKVVLRGDRRAQCAIGDQRDQLAEQLGGLLARGRAEPMHQPPAVYGRAAK